MLNESNHMKTINLTQIQSGSLKSILEHWEVLLFSEQLQSLIGYVTKTSTGRLKLC